MELLKNQEELEQICKDSKIAVVQFGSAACGPCTAIRERIALWQKKHETVRAVYIPVEYFPEAAAKESIFAEPTVLVYADGRLTIRKSGCFSLEDVLRRTERYLYLLEGKEVPAANQ